MFSGHGDDNVIKCTDGKLYNVTEIHSQFDNSRLDTLHGKPKIFIYDCCRGGDFDKTTKNKNSKIKKIKKYILDFFHFFFVSERVEHKNPQ